MRNNSNQPESRPNGRAEFSSKLPENELQVPGSAVRRLIKQMSILFQPEEDGPLHWKSNHKVDPPAVNGNDPLTVINLNLWHDWPRHRRLPERLEQVARLVEQEGAQIVLLQEAFRTSSIEAPRWLAERLGMRAIYQRANGNRSRIGFEEGPALLTSLPVLDVRFQTLKPSNEPFARRIALGAQIKTDCSTIWAFSTHLGLMRAQNAAQLEHLRKWVSETTGEQIALIGGDFNSDESTEQIAKISREWIDAFRRLHPGKQTHSHTLRWPWGTAIRKHRLDYLFLKPAASRLQFMEAVYVDQHGEPYSDHKALLVRLRHCQHN